MSLDSERRSNVALLALFAFAALAVLAFYLLMVRTEAGQDLDAAAYGGHALEAGLGADEAERLLQTISVGSLALATVAIALVAVARRRLGLVLVPLGIVAGAIGATEILKHFIFERPDLLGTGETKNSYPSGHTAVAISLGVAALVTVPGWMRVATGIGAVFYASAVGVATVAAGWHRPSDVLGAYLVTVAISALVVAAFRRVGPVAAIAPEPPARRRVPAAIALGAVLGLIAVFAIALAENARGIDWTTVDPGFIAYALLLPVSAAACVGALGAAIWGPSRAASPPRMDG